MDLADGLHTIIQFEISDRCYKLVNDLTVTTDDSLFKVVDGEEGDFGITRYFMDTGWPGDDKCIAVEFNFAGDHVELYFCNAIKPILKEKFGELADCVETFDGNFPDYLLAVFNRQRARDVLQSIPKIEEISQFLSPEECAEIKNQRILMEKEANIKIECPFDLETNKIPFWFQND